MFNSEVRADRKQRSRERREAAADRRIGHDLAYWMWLGPYIWPMIGMALVAGAVAWAWLNVPHESIARVLTFAGAALVVAWTARWMSGSTASARINERASGVVRNRWHPVGVAGLVLLTAAFAVWRSL